MERTKEMRAIPQTQQSNRFWYYGSELNVGEERLLYFIFTSLRYETSLRAAMSLSREEEYKTDEIPNRSYSLTRTKKEIREFFGKTENPLQPRHELKNKTKQQRVQETIEKMEGLMIYDDVFKLNQRADGSLVNTNDPDAKKIFSIFEFKDNKLFVEVNKDFADKYLYPAIDEGVGVSFISINEIKKYRSKYTFRLERLLKQKIHTGREGYQVHLPIKYLKQIMLGNQSDKYSAKRTHKENSHREREVVVDGWDNFRHRVLMKAIDELNKFSYLENIEIINVKHFDTTDGRVSIRYSSSKKKLQEIAPDAMYIEKAFNNLLETGKVSPTLKKKIKQLPETDKTTYRNVEDLRNTETTVELMTEDIEF